jgi:hypothetical protein
MSEKGELKRIGARPQKNSGRGKIQKGDGTIPGYVVDVKEYSKSFSVTQDVWAKICMDTMKTDPNRSPVIMLVLGDTKKTRLAIIEWNEFEQLRENNE